VIVIVAADNIRRYFWGRKGHCQNERNFLQKIVISNKKVLDK